VVVWTYAHSIHRRHGRGPPPPSQCPRPSSYLCSQSISNSQHHRGQPIEPYHGQALSDPSSLACRSLPFLAAPLPALCRMTSDAPSHASCLHVQHTRFPTHGQTLHEPDAAIHLPSSSGPILWRRRLLILVDVTTTHTHIVPSLLSSGAIGVGTSQRILRLQIPPLAAVGR
jgi:hypothetical protein